MDGTVSEGPYVDGRRNGKTGSIRYGAGAGSIAGLTTSGAFEDDERDGCWISQRPDGTGCHTLYEDGKSVVSGSCVRCVR